jgi:hypothetical protein
MNAKQVAKAIRAEIKALETQRDEIQARCESLNKIAIELEAENGGANPKSSKPLSEKTMKKILGILRKEKTPRP